MSAAKAARLALQLAGIAWGFWVLFPFFLSFLIPPSQQAMVAAGCCRTGWRMASDPSPGIRTGLRAGVKAGDGGMRTGSLIHSYLLEIQSIYLAFLLLSILFIPLPNLDLNSWSWTWALCSVLSLPSQTQSGLILCSWLQPPTHLVF